MKLNDSNLFRQQALINGEWLDANNGEVIDVTNPANGDKLGSVPKMGADETRAAIDAANRALPVWRALTAKERANILRNWFNLMMEHQDDLARHDAFPRLGVALQHVQQVLQAQHRPGGLAAVGVAVGLPVAQPFEQPHQPQVALGAAGLRVGSVQQRRQVPGGGRHAAARGWRVGGRINAARRCRPARTRAPGSRTSGRLR